MNLPFLSKSAFPQWEPGDRNQVIGRVVVLFRERSGSGLAQGPDFAVRGLSCLCGLPQVNVLLQAQPKVRGGIKKLGQPMSHIRGKTSLLGDDLVDGSSGHTNKHRQPLLSKPCGGHDFIAKQFPRVRRRQLLYPFHHYVLPSVIVLKIQIQHVAAVKSEGQAKIPGRNDCVLTFSPALQRMEIKTGKVQIPQVLGAIQSVESHADSLHYVGGNASGTAGREVPF